MSSTTVTAERVPRALERERRAVVAVFAVNGFLVATYLVRIPSLQAALHLPPPAMAAVLTGWGVMAIGAMRVVGPLVARFGSGRVVVSALGLLPAGLVVIGLVHAPLSLAIAVAGTGGVVGTLDVSMNAHALVVERRLGQPILNGCHAAVSVGAITGSLLGAWSVGADIGMTVEAAVIAGPVLLVALAVAGRLRSNPDGSTTRNRGRAPRPPWTLRALLLCSLGTALMLVEAAIISFGGVLLHSERGATLTQAALGYGTFAGFQGLGRMCGDRLTRATGDRRLFIGAAALAGAGVVVVVAAPTIPVSLVGFAAAGAGTSVLVPIVLRAVAGEQATAHSIAGATTFIYAGILLGPAAAGALAGWIGLLPTFACLVPVLIAVTCGGRAIPGRTDLGRRALNADRSHH